MKLPKHYLRNLSTDQNPDPPLQVVYVSYLAVGPWFWGQALDDASAPLSTFYLRHWNVSLGQNRDSVAVPMPCTLILALPFYLLVLFPWMLWIAAFSAFRDLARRPALKASLSIPPRRGKPWTVLISVRCCYG